MQLYNAVLHRNGEVAQGYLPVLRQGGATEIRDFIVTEYRPRLDIRNLFAWRVDHLGDNGVAIICIARSHCLDCFSKLRVRGALSAKQNGSRRPRYAFQKKAMRVRSVFTRCFGDPASPSCVNTTLELCKKVYNGKWYPGQDCANFDCPTAEPMGACCFSDPTTGLTCANTTKKVCLRVYGGTWYEGQDCANFDCPTISPLGACCYGDPASPSCVNTTESDCIANYGGNWYLGWGSSLGHYGCAH